jgi:hypothetical protein
MKDITIKNFRCYEEKSMEFRPGINLLIGDNSVGKTSLLRACNYVTSAFFCGYSQKYTKWISPSSYDFRFYESKDGSKAISKQIDLLFHVDENDFPPVTLPDGTIHKMDYTKELLIEKKSSKNAKPLKSGLKALKNYSQLLSKYAHVAENGTVTQYNALPVYAFFSAEDNHSIGRKFDKTGFKEEVQLPSFGYFECHESKGLLEGWFKRMLVLEEDGNYPMENNNVRTAIAEALGEGGCNIIQGYDFRVNKRQIRFHLTDGRKVYFEYLSDGYQRLVSIVIDIAIRCALLNKCIYGDEAYKKTHGTVIIDEIDEHLHPALQVRILKALRRTFPHIQFIVSTHSPLVISSVESCPENVVYKLEYDKQSGQYTHKELDTYGLDSNLILSEEMGTYVREPKIEHLIEQVEACISQRDIIKAKGLIEELEKQTSPNQPELIRLRAIIKRLEIIGR